MEGGREWGAGAERAWRQFDVHPSWPRSPQTLWQRKQCVTRVFAFFPATEISAYATADWDFGKVYSRHFLQLLTGIPTYSTADRDSGIFCSWNFGIFYNVLTAIPAYSTADCNSGIFYSWLRFRHILQLTEIRHILQLTEISAYSTADWDFGIFYSWLRFQHSLQLRFRHILQLTAIPAYSIAEISAYPTADWDSGIFYSYVHFLWWRLDGRPVSEQRACIRAVAGPFSRRLLIFSLWSNEAEIWNSGLVCWTFSEAGTEPFRW